MAIPPSNTPPRPGRARRAPMAAAPVKQTRGRSAGVKPNDPNMGAGRVTGLPGGGRGGKPDDPNMGAGRVSGLPRGGGIGPIGAPPQTVLRRSQASQEFARPGSPGMSGAPGGRPLPRLSDPNNGAGYVTGLPPSGRGVKPNDPNMGAGRVTGLPPSGASAGRGPTGTAVNRPVKPKLY